jgi:hypothetical protein
MLAAAAALRNEDQLFAGKTGLLYIDLSNKPRQSRLAKEVLFAMQLKLGARLAPSHAFPALTA